MAIGLWKISYHSTTFQKHEIELLCSLYSELINYALDSNPKLPCRNKDYDRLMTPTKGIPPHRAHIPYVYNWST